MPVYKEFNGSGYADILVKESLEKGTNTDSGTSRETNNEDLASEK